MRKVVISMNEKDFFKITHEMFKRDIQIELIDKEIVDEMLFAYESKRKTKGKLYAIYYSKDKVLSKEGIVYANSEEEAINLLVEEKCKNMSTLAKEDFKQNLITKNKSSEEVHKEVINENSKALFIKNFKSIKESFDKKVNLRFVNVRKYYPKENHFQWETEVYLDGKLISKDDNPEEIKKVLEEMGYIVNVETEEYPFL